MSVGIRSPNIDLSGGRSEDNPVELLVQGREVELKAVEGQVFYRLEEVDSKRQELRHQVFTAEPGEEIGMIYLDTGGATGASVEAVVREGFCVDYPPSEGPAGGESYVSPLRLDGNLAAGTALADGSDVAQQIDHPNTDRLRVRAEVTGIGSYSAVHSAALNGAVDLWAFENSNGAARLVTVDGAGATVRLYNAENPSALVLLDSLTLAAGEPAVRVVVDGTRDLVLVFVNDGTSTNADLTAVDASGDTLAEQGTGTIDGGSTWNFAGNGRPEADVLPAEEVVAVPHVLSSSANEELLLIGYHDPAGGPVLLDNDRPGFGSPQGVAFVPRDGTLWIIHPNGSSTSPNFRAYTVAGGAGGGLGVLVSSLQVGQAISGVNVGLLWDPESESLLWKGGDVAGRAELPTVQGLNPVEGLDTNIGAEAMVLDPARGYWYTAEENTPTDGGILLTIRNVVGLDTVQTIRMEPATGAGTGDPAFLTYDASSGQPFVLEVDDGQIGSLEIVEGPVFLHVLPLDANDERVETQVPDPVELTSDREGEVTVDLVGEEKSDVELRNRAGEAGSVAFVDVYREPAS